MRYHKNTYISIKKYILLYNKAQLIKKENNMIKKIINKNDLIALGYKTNTAMTIIRQAKKIMVQKGYAFYNNHRLDYVPIHAVEEIIGVSLLEEEKEDSQNNE